MKFVNEVDFDKAYIRDDRLERLKSILEKKNVEVVSTKWICVKDNYKLLCMSCEREWEERGSAFFNSRRRAGRDRWARSKASQSCLLGVGNLNSFAECFGGQCLYRDYFGRKHKNEWRCKAGHVLYETSTL